MIIRCPQCQVGLDVADDKVKADRRITCGACLHQFSPAAATAGAAPAALALSAASAQQPTPPPAAAEVPRPRPVSPRRGNWRRCAQHPQTRSEHVCSTCVQGYCRECVDFVRGVALCRSCQGLCVDASTHAEQEEEQHRKSRPMIEEAREVFGYPLTDKTAFVLMVVVVWVFSLARGSVGGGRVAILLSQGLLAAYAFNALERTSNGQFRDFFPEISGLGDLAAPLWASFAALLSAGWPLIVAAVLGWTTPVGPFAAPTQPKESAAVVAVAHAQDDEAPAPDFHEHEAGDTAANEYEAGDTAADEDDALAPWTAPPAAARPGPPAPPPARPAIGLWLLIVGVVWYVVYAPVALIVAAISRSAGPFSCLVQTLNPLVGISTILRMGSTYWQALGLYLAVAIPQVILGVVLSYAPFVGGPLRAFVDGYASLAMGCALGLAVFKKGDELGLHRAGGAS